MAAHIESSESSGKERVWSVQVHHYVGLRQKHGHGKDNYLLAQSGCKEKYVFVLFYECVPQTHTTVESVECHLNYI